MKRKKPRRPTQVIVVERDDNLEVYASEPIDVLYVEFHPDEGEITDSMIYGRPGVAPLRAAPAKVVEVFCTRTDPHDHRGDICRLGLPDETAEPEAPRLPGGYLRAEGKMIPLSEEMAAEVRKQRQRFIEKFGREPGPKDPLFFDPTADEPRPIIDEVMDQHLLEAMRAAKVRPEIIYAYQKTGRLVTTENAKHLTPEELREWEAAVEEWRDAHGEE